MPPDTKDDGTKKIAPVDEPTAKAPAKPDTPVDDGKKEEKLILGKYKSAEDLAKAHTELEGKLGTQGTDLGLLRNCSTPSDQGRKGQEARSTSGNRLRQREQRDL